MAVLHTIKAWLYENLLTEDKNDYSARVSAERSLNIRDICESAVARGGADINAGAMEHAVNLFHKEMAYRLCDGFSVNTGWYNASTHVKGVFAGAAEPFDPEKHHIMVEFRQGAELRRELGMVNVDILGKAESGFFINEVSDKRTGSVNDLLTPGRNAKISGGKLKVEGTDPSCGVYFVNEADGARVKVDEADIVENLNAHLLIIVPALPANLPPGSNHPIHGRRRQAPKVPPHRHIRPPFDRRIRTKSKWQGAKSKAIYCSNYTRKFSFCRRVLPRLRILYTYTYVYNLL